MTENGSEQPHRYAPIKLIELIEWQRTKNGVQNRVNLSKVTFSMQN